MTDSSAETPTPAPQPGQPPAPPLPEPTPADDVLEAEPTIEGEDFSRVAFTRAAVTQLQRLIDRNGPLMFHQSGGCCDGSSPMCYPAGDFLTGDADVRMGHVEVPLPDGTTSPLDFWMSREQFAYWRHTHLTIDLVDGRGGGFSLEIARRQAVPHPLPDAPGGRAGQGAPGHLSSLDPGAGQVFCAGPRPVSCSGPRPFAWAIAASRCSIMRSTSSRPRLMTVPTTTMRIASAVLRGMWAMSARATRDMASA
jgi:uncharacterized protein (DUF779 family)